MFFPLLFRKFYTVPVQLLTSSSQKLTWHHHTTNSRTGSSSQHSATRPPQEARIHSGAPSGPGDHTACIAEKPPKAIVEQSALLLRITHSLYLSNFISVRRKFGFKYYNSWLNYTHLKAWFFFAASSLSTAQQLPGMCLVSSHTDHL